ncbi:hypothetical protein [Thermocatellispora tengchongensis]
MLCALASTAAYRAVPLKASGLTRACTAWSVQVVPATALASALVPD